MIYFEDLQVGSEIEFGTYHVTRDEVLEFARKYDIPLHIGVTEAGPLVSGIVKSTLAFYNIADHYKDLIASMGFAEESARIRETYRESGFRAAHARERCVNY